jgi:hypothetical protein
MSQACAAWRGDIAACLVGGLDANELARTMRHLRRCVACRTEYNELAPVRDWLDRVTEFRDDRMRDAARLRPPGPPAISPAWSRLRRLAAAAVIISITAAAALAVVISGPTPHTFRAVNLATDVSGQAQLRREPTGTEIGLAVAGLPPGVRCTLVAVSGTQADVAGTWSATYDGTARITGMTSIPPSRLAAVLVESAAGQLLLRIPV